MKCLAFTCPPFASGSLEPFEGHFVPFTLYLWFSFLALRGWRPPSRLCTLRYAAQLPERSTTLRSLLSGFRHAPACRRLLFVPLCASLLSFIRFISVRRAIFFSSFHHPLSSDPVEKADICACTLLSFTDSVISCYAVPHGSVFPYLSYLCREVDVRPFLFIYVSYSVPFWDGDQVTTRF